MRDGVIFDRTRDLNLPSILSGRKRQEGKDSSIHKSARVFSELTELDSLINSCTRMLFRISAVFPLDFFPDEITIDECKVNIVFRQFFFSEDVHSINIDMIRDVDVEAGPFFATLKVVPDGYPSHPLNIRYLKKKDAFKARSIIQGLMVAKKRNINLSRIEASDLLDKLELMGRTHIVESDGVRKSR